jgi:hypothetical protein
MLSMNLLYDVTFLAINLITPLAHKCIDINIIFSSKFTQRYSCIEKCRYKKQNFVPFYFEASRLIYHQKSFIFTIWQKPKKNAWFHFQMETVFHSKGYKNGILEFKYVAFHFASVVGDTIGTEWYRKHSFDSSSTETRITREDGHSEDTNLLWWHRLRTH